MASAHPPRKPTFLWQGLLILFPVAVLAGVGSWALRQDRAAVEREAKGRAESVASAVLADLEQFLGPVSVTEERGVFHVRITGNACAFAVSSNNALVEPTPVTWPPQPNPLPVDLNGILRSNKLNQWREAETAFAKSNWEQSAQLYLTFLNGRRRIETNVMADIESGIGGRGPGRIFYGSLQYRSLALFRRGIAFERLGETNQAIEAYQDVLAAQGNGSEISEVGLPMAHLVALKILDLAQDDFSRLPAEWQTNPVPIVIKLSYDVSPFEQELVGRLGKLKPELSAVVTPAAFLTQALDGWQRDVESRRLYGEAADARAANTAPWPAAFWVEGISSWLALAAGPFRDPGELPTARRYFVAFRESGLSTALTEFVEREDRTGNFAIRMELGGRTFPARERATTDWQRREISHAARATDGNLLVAATLADPPAFFAAQQKRRRLLSLALLVAAATCVLAFFWARLAFTRQLRLNEMKSNFVSSVSHELRAPIASVRLMAESLERGKISEPVKQNEYFRFIVQECRRLSSLIENVLDFSRIEQGRKQYEFEPTNVTALVEQTVRLMEPCAAEKGVHLKSEIRNPKSEIELDGRAMQQALVNLIDNAIKHSPKGETVTVGLEVSGAKGQVSGAAPDANLTPDTPHLTLFVADRGPGIPTSEHERIFERFHRLGSELRRETQGVGIGLSIVKHIVAAQGGRVRVESEVGKGSRFTIELPIK